MNSDIIGLVPGAGKSTRFKKKIKELLPINIGAASSSQAIVLSEIIVTLLRNGGARQILFVINSGKMRIMEYYAKLGLTAKYNLRFIIQENIDKYYGMPYAIDAAYEELKEKTVLMGMPDTILQPNDSFSILLDNFAEHDADIELGLYETDSQNPGGYIRYNPVTHLVNTHIDKTSRNFPKEYANNTWAIACWNHTFTQFMHKFVADAKTEYSDYGHRKKKELLFGDLIDAALNEGTLRVCADYISHNYGRYFDVTNPHKYQMFMLHSRDFNIRQSGFCIK